MGTAPRGLQFKAADQFVIKVPAAREQALAAAHAILDLLDRLRRETGEGVVRSRPPAAETAKEPT